jgi:fibronectin type 3 domain-containing protein
MKTFKQKFFIYYLLIVICYLFSTCVIPNGNNWNGSQGAEGLALPANINASAMSSDSIFLTWEEAEGVEIYAVFSSNSRTGNYELIDEVDECFFTDVHLNPSTTYFYRVASVSADGTGPMSDSIQARTLDAGAVPLLRPPSGITGEVLSPRSIRITWDSVSGGQYNIYRAASFSGERTKLNAEPLVVTSYTETALTPSTAYFYFLSTLNADGVEGPFSPGLLVSTPSSIDPSMPVPTELSTEAEGWTDIRVSWNAVTEAVGYNLYVSTTENGTFTILTFVNGVTFLHELTLNSTRFYRVSAVRANERESNLSAVVSGSTRLLPVPTGLSAEALSATEIRLTWNPVEDAVSYVIYRATSETGSYTQIATPVSSPYVDSELNQNTTYFYRVSVAVSPGEGSQSAPANARTLTAPVTPPGADLTAQLAHIRNYMGDGTVFEIVVHNDVFMGPTTVSTMGRDITVNIRSASSASVRTIQLDGQGHLFSIDTGVTVRLQDIVLRGHSTNNRALIAVGNGTLILNSGARVTNNRHTGGDLRGGGIRVSGGVLELNDGAFVNGHSIRGGNAYGGGIYVENGGNVTIQGGTISENTVEIDSGTGSRNAHGGGLYITGNSTVTMSGGVISKNSCSPSFVFTSGFGGGIFIENGTFVKRAALGSSTSGVIFGGSGEDANIAANGNGGHAIRRNFGSLRNRNTTLGPGDEISTGNDIGWE